MWYNPAKKDIIDGLSASRVRDIYNMGFMQFLPNTQDKSGNLVTALRMGKVDYSNPAYTPKAMIALSLYILCYLFENDDFQ